MWSQPKALRECYREHIYYCLHYYKEFHNTKISIAHVSAFDIGYGLMMSCEIY